MSKNNSKKSKKKFFIFGGLTILLLIVLALVFFNKNDEKIIKVQTEKVQKRDITQVVSATGKINPVYSVELRPEVTGEIVQLPVKEGDHVRKGQFLIRLKPDQYIARKNKALASLNFSKATLAQREATLAKVKADFERVKKLYEKDLSSKADLEAARSSYLGAKAQVEAQQSSVMQAEESYKDAEVELAKTAIYSPLTGTITYLKVEVGERVLGSSFSQGTLLMTVSDLTSMEATVQVDENDVVLISVGDTAKIKIDAFGDEEFLGTVSQIGNSAITTGVGSQDQVVNFDVKIRLKNPNEKIRPGMSCDAEIQTETRNNVLSVPIQCVTARMHKPKSMRKRGNKPDMKKAAKKSKPQEVVFVVEGNLARMKPVKTGISNDSYIEIIKGLKEGQQVVTGPYRAISKELQDSVKIMLEKKFSKGPKH